MTAPPVAAAAARRLANRLVIERALSPPVDVRVLLEEFADVEELDWPQREVDAVVGSLSDERPRVMLRASANHHRRRFTMGHELGHILVPWHVGGNVCHPETGEVELPSFGEEDEADVFASTLLLPDAWLQAVVTQHPSDMTSLLEEVSRADVSTAAIMTALRRTLLAGWIFVGYGGRRAWYTPGTDFPVYEWSAMAAHARQNASEHGTASVNGHPLHWFRMVPPQDLPPADQDTRSTTQLLEAAIGSLHTDADSRARATKSANGVVGGSLRNAAGRPALETFNTLRYKFSRTPLAPLLDHPDFQTWLARKARSKEQAPSRI